MREENRSRRQHQIENAAYKLLEEKGYSGTSMQGIARKAKASNETLYNWYGDKLGLYKALVSRNAIEVSKLLEDGLSGEKEPLSILASLGPKLLTLLLGERAVALNRAAVGDSTGELGAALAQAGRESVLPLLIRVMETARRQNQLSFDEPEDAVGLYLDLLIGDLQIRRLIGRVGPPSRQFCENRSALALRRFRHLMGESGQGSSVKHPDTPYNSIT